jgi:hypothetical protein
LASCLTKIKGRHKTVHQPCNFAALVFILAALSLTFHQAMVKV